MRQIEKDFFNKLAEKLEELFPKGERCQCGKKLPCRSKALAFNAFANIYLRTALQKAYIRGYLDRMDDISKEYDRTHRSFWERWFK